MIIKPDMRDFIMKKTCIKLRKRLIAIMTAMLSVCSVFMSDFSAASVQAKGSKDVLNVLLIGNDQREDENARSDSMILVSLDMEENTVKMVSFMRDTYISIDGYKDNRINAAYSFGGKELLKETIEKNFPVIHIDNTVEVDFSGFKSVIDILGGIDMELNVDEIKIINQDSQSENGPIPEKDGTYHLDGKQALSFSRIRYTGNGDFERTERQRRVLMEIAKNYANVDFIRLIRLYVEVSSYIETDMSYSQILKIARHVKDFDIENMETYNIPQDAGYEDAVKRGMMVLVPDLDKCNELLGNIIG